MEFPNLPLITDVTDLRGKRVLVRAPFNVPIKDGVVQNEFRIRRALATLEYLTDAGARVIIISHIGREKTETLHPVYEVLKKYLTITWSPELLGAQVSKMVAEMPEGTVVMLENLRSRDGETDNDPAFAEELVSLADMYVNDAFSASHREHASIVGVPKYLPSYAGILFNEEYTELQKAMQPESPSLFILGGAKFETKLSLVEQYLKIYDTVFVGGALANDLFRARGYEVGTSVVSDVDLSASTFLNNKHLLLPTDVTVKSGEIVRVTTPDDVHKEEIIYDAGPKTLGLLAGQIKEAKTVLWNGPLGYFEGGFAEYTKQCAELIAESKAHSVVGGGDTIAAIEALGINDRFGFVSTAGGAMLVFLEKGTLPGIDALRITV